MQLKSIYMQKFRLLFRGINNFKVNNMQDTMLKSIDMTIKQISGEEIDESKLPKLNSREELLNIYQAFKKTILLLENIFV